MNEKIIQHAAEYVLSLLIIDRVKKTAKDSRMKTY